jgi:GT2 family glycosyltransferase
MSHTAVVILNYNGEKLLPQFLPSVIQHSPEAEIIVADNGSTDQSLALLENQYPQVRIIRLAQNLGFCGGYNAALKQVKAETYVLLNSDVEVTQGWLVPMLSILSTKPAVAAVQPKILSHQERSLFEYAGAGGGFIDSLGYPFCRGRVFNHVESDQHQYDDERQVFWASGACMMIRAEVYHRFGGLDEDFFAHMEEIDLCWKIYRSGGEVYYTGSSVVYHLGAGTLGYANPRKTYLNFRNGLVMITKHFSPWEMTWKIPFRVVLDWAAIGMFLLKSQPEHGKAVLKAHVDFAKRLSVTLSKRRELRQQYPVYNHSAVYRGIALLQYFLFGRKRLI